MTTLLVAFGAVALALIATWVAALFDQRAIRQEAVERQQEDQP